MAELERLVVIGAAGHGRELLDIIADVNRRSPTWDVVGVIDDGDPELDLLGAHGVDHLGASDALTEHAGAAFVVGIGDPGTRAELTGRAAEAGLRAAPPILHSSATCGSQGRMADGVAAWPHAAVTTNVTLGAHVHLNQHATVGHDAVLGDFVTVNPGASVSGGVRLGDRVLVGAGAVVLQYLAIGEGTTIGAGAVVTRDLPAGVTAKGVPAVPDHRV